MYFKLGFPAVAAAALLAVANARAAVVEKPVTVIFNNQTAKLDAALVDKDQLWVALADVHHANGFEAKPQGLCAGDVCIPIPRANGWTAQHGDKKYFNVTRFAAKVDQVVAADSSGDVWSFGTVGDLEGNRLPAGVAPDFALPDRSGKTVKLSDFRGKKVLILTWASW